MTDQTNTASDLELDLTTPAPTLTPDQEDLLATLKLKQADAGFEKRGASGRKVRKPFIITTSQLLGAVNDFRRATKKSPLELSEPMLLGEVLLLAGAGQGVQILRTTTIPLTKNTNTVEFVIRVVSTKENRYKDMTSKNAARGIKRRSCYATDDQWEAIKAFLKDSKWPGADK